MPRSVQKREKVSKAVYSTTKEKEKADRSHATAERLGCDILAEIAVGMKNL